MPNTPLATLAPTWRRGERDPNPDFLDGEIVRRVLDGKKVDRPLHHAERLAVAAGLREQRPDDHGADRLATIVGCNRTQANALIAQLDKETDRDRLRRRRRLAL